MNNKSQNKLIFEKILTVFAWISFVVAILISTLSIFASFSDQKNGKEIFGVKLFIVASDSMSKSSLSKNEKIFFNAGDLLIIKTTDANTIFLTNDVITFISYNPDSYGKILTHKIREVKYSTSGKLIGYVTYGINTGVNDQTLVKPESVIGKYVGKIENLGSLFAFYKTPAGYYTSILIPCILLVVFFSIKVGKGLGKREFSVDNVDEIEKLKSRVLLLEQSLIPNNSKDNENNTPILQLLQEETKDLFVKIHNQLSAYKQLTYNKLDDVTIYKFGVKTIAKIFFKQNEINLQLALTNDELNQIASQIDDKTKIINYNSRPFLVRYKSQFAKDSAQTFITVLANKYNLTK